MFISVRNYIAILGFCIQAIAFSSYAEEALPLDPVLSSAGERPKMIDIARSSRYPAKRFIRPFLSPDCKWLIFRKSSAGWKGLYYTRVGSHDENQVPLPPGKGLERVGESVLWSQDGKTLALSAFVNGSERIVLVDFSGDSPTFIESVRGRGGEGILRWSPDGTLIYVDDRFNIVRKTPGKTAETVVKLRQSGKRVDALDAAAGVLVYRSGKKVYSKEMNVSGRPSLVFSGETAGISLSPNGRHLLLLLKGKERKKGIIVEPASGRRTTLPLRIARAAWSPDGNRLAYAEETSPRKDDDNPSRVIWWNPHFFVSDIASGETRDYGPGISKEFNWTPDGGHIIYSMKTAHPYLRVYGNGIFVVRASDGSEIGQVSGVSANSPPVVSVSGRQISWRGLNMDALIVAENPLPAEIFAAGDKGR